MFHDNSEDFKVLIGGGGIGGLSLGIILKQAGISCKIFEKIPEQKRVGSSMGIWPNATKILKEMNILEDVAARSVQAQLIEIADQLGDSIQTVQVRELLNPALFIHRADLMDALLTNIPPGIFQPGRAIKEFEESSGGVRVYLSDGTEETGNRLIGADGLRSQVRESLFGESSPLYLGYVAYYGTAEYTHPSLLPGSVKMRFGNGLRFMSCPLQNGMVEWTAIVNKYEGEKEVVDSQELQKENLLEIYQDWEQPILELMQVTPEIEATAIHDRIPTKNWGRGSVSLLGDAAHPTAPTLALGACMAIEDASVLARNIQQAISDKRNPAQALRNYEKQRFNRTRLVTLGSKLVGQMGQNQNPYLNAAGNALIKSIPSELINSTYNQLLKAFTSRDI